jgi:hypothetical protein
VISRRREPAPGPDAWEDEGRRLAPQLAGLSVAVVLGADASAAARVAIGAARATARERHVAVADLTGATAALGVIAPGATGPGITESFVHGISLNDVARPAADQTPSLFILPRGAEPLTAELVRSERWGRLAAGFAEAGALLLILAPSDVPGLETLVPRTDGVIAVGTADVPMAWRVIAQVGDQRSTPAEPAIAPAPRAPSRRRAAIVIVTVLALAAGGLALWKRGWTGMGLPASVARTTPASAGRAAGQAVGTGALTVGPGAPAPTLPADTVPVAEPVNPSDSAIAAQFAVEIVATNTATGANLWLRERGARLPGGTVSPVVMGAARVRWHKVLAGAWRDRFGADSMLAALRRDGVLGAGAGLVVRVPLALLLEAEVPRADAAARVAALAARGVEGYALLQDDGSVRLYAGAFETAAAAVPLDAELRAAGLHPQLAYRTGRTF